MNGYYVFANTKTGEFITLSPPMELTDLPRGATAYPITKVEHTGIREGTLTWDQPTRTVVASEVTNQKGNKAKLTNKLWQGYLDNQTYIALDPPTQNQVNRQVDDLTKQVNWLIRLVTDRLEADD